MDPIVRIDLTDPDPRGQTVVIETPAGTIEVKAGFFTSKNRSIVRVQFDRADGWDIDMSNNQVMGTAEVRQTRES